MNKSKEAYERAVFVISTTGGTAHDVDPITGYVIKLEARIAELEKLYEGLMAMYDLGLAKYDALKYRIESAPIFSVSRHKQTGGICLVAHLSDQNSAAWEDIVIYAVPEDEKQKNRKSKISIEELDEKEEK